MVINNNTYKLQSKPSRYLSYQNHLVSSLKIVKYKVNELSPKIFTEVK